jgi:hypothetical protein
MFDEPTEPRGERATAPEQRAREKADELRMHAELAAIYEGPRKFDAEVCVGLDAEVVRDVQRSMAKLARERVQETPVITPASMPEAVRILTLNEASHLATSDYHVYQRPAEVMIVRWLAGDEVQTFYDRLQAHFDAAIAQVRDDERNNHGWKNEPGIAAYLDALDNLEISMAERYLREPIRKHGLFVCSSWSADEINILFLANHLMGVDVERIVGKVFAPADESDESQLAWYFKVFALRGKVEGVERMCFFTFLQKSASDDLDS